MIYAFHGDFESPQLKSLKIHLSEIMDGHGHSQTSDPGQAGLVFHEVLPERPRPFRRMSQATFVVGIIPWTGDAWEKPLAALYPLLVRSLSNLAIAAAPDRPLVLITPELGYYTVDVQSLDWQDDLYQRIAPLAGSHLVIDNIFDPDLPESLWNGTSVTDDMREASRRLAAWDLFPSPYPLADTLPPEDYKHLKRVFGIGGLSYGNLSARHDGNTFWMSASGVDKAKIGTVSSDILLVKGYDASARAMRISVQPDSHPHRVSVDAVEHWGIYQRHPEIGALIHIHAWMENIPSTSVNYPCGTVEMGDAMSELLDQDPHPERTIIGLKNHGITATGPNFPDILSRLEGHIRTQVPMM